MRRAKLDKDLVVGLRVLALNVWGMPAVVGAQDKELRISAIGDLVHRGEHDLYLFSEVSLILIMFLVMTDLVFFSCG